VHTKVSTKGQVVLPGPIRGDWDFAPAIRSTSAVCKRGNLAQAEQTLIWSGECQAQQFCKHLQ